MTRMLSDWFCKNILICKKLSAKVLIPIFISYLANFMLDKLLIKQITLTFELNFCLI